MLVIFFRAIILYVALLVVMRLMGKRQIGEMQPFEFIITLLIAELACIPMTDISIPLSYGLVSVIAVFILHQIMSLLERSGKFVRFLISGKPSIVINEDGIVMKELKKNNLNIQDLQEAMRAQGYFSFENVKYAIFESNGKLSVMENIKEENFKNDLAFIIINNGKVNKGNLEGLGITESDLLIFLKKQNVKVKDIEVLTMDKNLRCYFKITGKKYKILNFEKGIDI